ncbi:MAG: DUF763 domain-containing protein [bacterium]
MSKTGTATLPLHYGKAPAWLFSRMTMLSREIVHAIVREFGQNALLEKLSDPFWFQAFGCVLGFDWHSSGLTTTVTGALKEGLKGIEREIGIFMGGGKGAAARKTPEQIRAYADTLSLDPESLIYASKMSAKVDSTAVQDGYQLYHHVFIFTSGAEWTVIQQGMNEGNRMARRYHWLGSSVKDFVAEPHRAICCDARNVTLNMVAQESEEARQITTVLAREKPEKVVQEIEKIQKLEMTRRHTISNGDIDPRKICRTLLKSYESQPENFEKLLGVQGVGAKTIRALSLISEIVYGKSPSFRDPARFSFAHGGKDGTPFPVDERTYDRTIDVMRRAINSSKIGNQDKLDAVRKLTLYYRD